MSDTMRHHPQPDLPRMMELLADRTTGALTEADRAELESLLRRVPPVMDEDGQEVDQESMDRAVGALTNAMVGKTAQPLPAALRERLLRQGEQMVAAGAMRGDAGGGARTRPGVMSWMGWAVAAAIVVAVVLYQRSPAPAPLTLAQQRAALLSDAETLTVAWSGTEEPAARGLTGDVVWNGRLQTGYIRFKNLAPNDPTMSRYQLWIFCAMRDDRYPVDGGVFSIDLAEADPASGDVIIPFSAKLRVRQAAAFAVTIETPQGVVVSDRAHVVAMAPVKR